MTGNPKPDVCAGLAPILVSRYDVLTDTSAKEILAYNEYGERMCHWSQR